MAREETRTCTFELDPRGFVRATMKPGAQFDLEDARECVAATARACGTPPTRALVDSRGVRSQTRAAREHFASQEAARIVPVVALLVGSPVSRMIGNFFVRIHRPANKAQLFTNEAEAVSWLLAQPPR